MAHPSRQRATTVMGRPRVNLTAYRIVAAPYNGWLHDDQFWSIEEWYRQEHRRRQWRKYASRRRGSATPGEGSPHSFNASGLAGEGE